MKKILGLLACCASANAFCASHAVSKTGLAAPSGSARDALASRQSLRSHRKSFPFSLAMGSAAASTLAAAQAATVEKIKGARSMEPKGYPSEMGMDVFSVGDGQGTLTAFEAPGKNNVAWCSSLNIAGATTLSSLTTWCGPLMEVPHLVTRTVVSDASVDLFIDFRPRAYAAYETRLEDGSYGEPDTREWFGHKAVRDGCAELFFGPEAEAWANALRSQGACKPKATGDDLLYRGPLTIDISLPASEASVALSAKACTEAADMWLGWMESTPPLPAGMKVTSTYAYDTKMRAQLFGVMVGFYESLYGGHGRNLAAADAGPLDEAYVGGAS